MITPRFSYLLGVLAIAAMLGAAPASAQSVVPTGIWLTDDGLAGIKFSACAQSVCGQIVWLKPGIGHDGKSPRDYQNPDPALQSRPLCGLTVITGLASAQAGQWQDGQVYSVRTGRTVSLEMRQLSADQLEIHGYIGTPLMGRTRVFTRATQNLPQCSSNS